MTMQDAKDALEEGRAEEALEILLASSEPEKRNAEWCHLAGVCLTRMKLVNPAASFLARELELDPKNIASRRYFGELLTNFQIGPRHELEIEDILSKLSSDTLVIDVGSGVGNFSQRFLENSFKVLSIEPCGRSAEYQTIRYKDEIEFGFLKVIQGACSDSSGPARMWIGDDPYATFNTLEPSWKENFYKEYLGGTQEDVLKETLSIIVKQFGGGKEYFLKIDACGHEREVLNGVDDEAGSLCSFIMIEFVGAPGSHFTVNEAAHDLKRRGFGSARLVSYFGRLVIDDTKWREISHFEETPFPLLTDMSAGKPTELVIASLIARRGGVS